MITTCDTTDCDRQPPAGHNICRRCAALARGNRDTTTPPHIGHRGSAARVEYCYEHDMPSKYTTTRPNDGDGQARYNEATDSVEVSAAFLTAYVWRPDPGEANLRTHPARAAEQLRRSRAMTAAVKTIDGDLDRH